MKGYLFVTGCGRSGTSLLGKIICRHPKIILGIERYIKLCAENFPDFQPELFEHDRFFDFRGSDRKGFENPPNPPQQAFYDRMQDKWDEAWYRGDKLPTLFVRFEHVLETFENVKFVHITRNIDDVASSFNARVVAGTFPKHFDYKKAVELWNKANIHALKFYEKHPDRIVLLDYERLLQKGNVEKVINAIDPDLGFPAILTRLVEVEEDKSREIAKRRKENRLDHDGQHGYIQKMADFDTYEAVMAKSIFSEP